MTEQSVEVHWVEPLLPSKPFKRPGLTGRRYRIARRRYGRAVRAWRRAGRPMRERAVFMPRAVVEVSEAFGVPPQMMLHATLYANAQIETDEAYRILTGQPV